MATYRVEVCQRWKVIEYEWFEVEAEDEVQARKQALEDMTRCGFDSACQTHYFDSEAPYTDRLTRED